MTEALRKAIELAQQQPEEQQDVIARLILQEIQAHPTLLGQRGTETLQEKKSQRIESLGWSEEEAAKVRESLLSFEEDWNDPGMNIYDEL